MKKLTKLMLTLTLLVLGVGGVKAEKLYADLSKLSNGPSSTWDGATNTMTWTQQSNNMISYFDFAAGDYKNFSKIVVDYSELTNADAIRVQIRANGAEKTVALKGNGIHEKELIKDFGFTLEDLESLEWIRLLGCGYYDGETHTISADNPASAKINSVYLLAPSRTLNVDLSKMDASKDNATWNMETGVFAWTLNYSNAITLPGLQGNLSSYTKLNYETAAGSSESFRILIYYSNGAAQTTYVATVGNKSVSFEEMGVASKNLASVESIKISGASTLEKGNIKVNSISLEGPVIISITEEEIYKAPTGTTDVDGMMGADSKNWSMDYPKLVENETLFGGDIDSDKQSVDISSYDYLHFVVTEASADANVGLRVFTTTTSGTRDQLYPHPIADYESVTDWTAKYMITEPGVYVVKISDYPLLRGFKSLQGWNGNAGSIRISMIYLSTGAAPVNYTPSGEFRRANEDAIGDPTAVCFDVRSIASTDNTFTPANPNALFIAKSSSTLSTTQNVIVDGTCANLVLTDKKPFKAPFSFNATAATLNREVSNGSFATICAPFAITGATGTFYQPSELTAEGVLNFATEATPAAGKAYLFKASADVTAFTGSGTVVAEPVDNGEGVVMKGTFSQIAKVDEGSYILSGSSLYKVDSDVALAPFRAYFEVPAVAPARINLHFDEETTGIETVNSSMNNVEGYYNLNGQRVAQPTKGLYIVNGKKVMVK